MEKKSLLKILKNIGKFQKHIIKDQISKTSKYNLTTEIEKKRNPTFQNFWDYSSAFQEFFTKTQRKIL